MAKHHKMLMLWTVIAVCVHWAAAEQEHLEVVVNAPPGSVPMNHFWRSTGFCPPRPHQSAADFDLSPDMVQNLAYIGAVPHSGIQQVRIHWLFDLVKVERFSSSRQPVYNFTELDQLIDLLYVNDLRPGFEIMGSPSGIFTDMENKTQLFWWRDMVTQLAVRYINRYGLDYVRMWNFESWNEPDCQRGLYFDEVYMTAKGFVNYYDACSEGLKAASPLLTFGGPGDSCDYTFKSKEGYEESAHHHPPSSAYSDALYNHVVNGTNYFTGKKDVRLDFISLHRKGNESSRNIMEGELTAISNVTKYFPSIAKKPFYNDEADPLAGWDKDQEWRATASYAAMAVKVIAQHQNILVGPGNTSINYTLLSNDNGFLSYYPYQFTQRTLVARFQMNFTSLTDSNNNNNSSYKSEKGRVKTMDGRGKEGVAGKVKYVTFVRKPIHTAMALLAKLGDRQVKSWIRFADEPARSLPIDSDIGAVATMHTPSDNNTSDSAQWTNIVYSSNDTWLVPNNVCKLDFTWYITAINAEDLMLAAYVINEEKSNPYKSWADTYKKVDFPSLEQFAVIRQNEGPYRQSLTAVSTGEMGGVIIPSIDLPQPGILLLHLCQRSQFPPEQVTGLRMINITAGQVLIRWSDTNVKTKCIKTFEVEQLDTSTGQYKWINSDDTIVNIFVHATDSEVRVRGSYRVCAVDYWQRPGSYSQAISYTD